MPHAMTMVEKILARHAHVGTASAGEFLECDVDLVLANDVTAPIAIREFEKMGATAPHDPDQVVLVLDHYVPNKDIASAEQSKIVRDFARRQGIRRFFECAGVEHALLPEKGLIHPGDLIIGADSHTCTYGAFGAFATGVGSTDAAAAFATGQAWFSVPQTTRYTFEGPRPEHVTSKDLILYLIGRIGVSGALSQAMEFYGDAIRALSMEGRMTMCNMAVEAGAVAGLISGDEVTMRYLASRGAVAGLPVMGDEGASYVDEVKVDVSQLVPQVACPNRPDNVRPASELADIALDQVVIGSCTNGRIEDMREAARILDGRSIAPNLRCIVIPATREVALMCLDEGLTKVFLDAGCIVSTPTCGPCLGGYMGVLAAGERALATTNRNFTGRMGSPQAEVYLASPAVAAASAVLGHIALPDDVEVGA